MNFVRHLKEHWLAAILFLLFLSTANLAATDSQRRELMSADAAFHAGYAAEKKGDLPAARKQFEKVVLLAPDIAEGHSALGSVLLQLGQYDVAVRELARALALKPGDRNAKISLAIAYEQSGDHQRSIATFQSLNQNAASDPPGVVIFYIRALAANKQTDVAIAKAQRAVAETPEDPALRDVLGSLNAQKQDWTSAVMHFREALRLNPNFAEAHLHLGVALMMQQQTQQARDELETAAELSPQSSLVQIEFGKALLATREEARAVEVLRRALVLSPASLEGKYQLALALQANGQDEQAIPFFREAVAAEPHNAPALSNLGLALVQTGKSKEAIPMYQRALKEAPADSLIYQDLGVAYLQENDLEDAIVEFRSGLKLVPEAYELHYDLGLALKLKDDVAGATIELETAARLNPNSPDPPYTLGILNMQLGRFDEATEQLKIALTLRPENGDGWATLGSVYKQQNKLAEATEAIRKAIEVMPSQPGPHITLAGILAQQGKTAEAAAERKQAAVLTRTAVNRQRAVFAANSGSALLLKGQIADAIDRYQEAVTSDPTYVEGHRGLATALARAGRKVESEAEQQKAAQLEHP